jgi:hypothetical protein
VLQKGLLGNKDFCWLKSYSAATADGRIPHIPLHNHIDPHPTSPTSPQCGAAAVAR